ncbi:MAG: class I SAM-dependent methyltransferase [Pirellulaceae bacterium]|nr:class I SAM-dependent methyltransferase [Pirellulaceae bacterium]
MIHSTLVKTAIRAVEAGYVPDIITRMAIRYLCRKRLTSLDALDPKANAEKLQEFIDGGSNGPIAPIPECANDQHYEVPVEFYAQVLGQRYKYSSCLWSDRVTSLEQAEEASLAESCRHAALEDGMEVLELGCGWGALSLWILENYPQCRVTAVSNSHSQREFILSQARHVGVADRLTLITADMNDFASAHQFDRVMSIEMFEHMRNYRELLRRISMWLRPEGKLFVHIFCHKQFAYEFNDEKADDWMSRNFFSGGIMPSENIFRYFAEEMQVTDQWHWNGVHYQKTAEAWIQNMDDRRQVMLPILSRIYGRQQARRWWMRWRLLFLAGSELFGYKQGTEWYVSHYLFERASV